MVVMAFDYGQHRIGVAIGNSELKIPHPLAIIKGCTNIHKLAEINKLILTWQPKLLVVGMPHGGDKILIDVRRDHLIATINKFCKRLRHNFQLNVMLVNEDYTSSLAAIQLSEQQIYGTQQKGKIDSLAACNILNSYWENLP